MSGTVYANPEYRDVDVGAIIQGGFTIAERIVIGDREPTLQSFVIYVGRVPA